MNYLPAEILRYYLVSQSIGAIPLPRTATVWPISVSSMQEEIDNAICVYDTKGRYDGRDMRSGDVNIHPGFQIRLRAESYRVGSSKAKDILAALDTAIRVTVATGSDPVVEYLLHSVSRSENWMFLGEEPERKRVLWTLNGVLTLEDTF